MTSDIFKKFYFPDKESFNKFIIDSIADGMNVPEIAQVLADQYESLLEDEIDIAAELSEYLKQNQSVIEDGFTKQREVLQNLQDLTRKRRDQGWESTESISDMDGNILSEKDKFSNEGREKAQRLLNDPFLRSERASAVKTTGAIAGQIPIIQLVDSEELMNEIKNDEKFHTPGEDDKPDPNLN